ncbi:MAG: BBP7 family outer membrane beta-barrel protein, partial [Planctomycetales bacterium]|nr:BBP7 family outer membrane beta-barrel protein [Planctomycetales bacterium]
MQSQTKACIVSLLLIGLCATDVDAQAVHAGAPSAAPGLWYKGIYVGRMPQREKLLEHTPQARKDEFVRQASRQVEELHLEPEAFDLPDDTESRFVEPEGAFEEPAGDYESTVDYPASRNHYPPIRRGGHMAMGCGPAICCGDDRFFVSAEYLLYWSKGMDLPALATTSPDGTPDTEAGVLGFDDTTVLFGQDKVLDDARSGVRFALGYWLDSCATYA